MGNENTRGAVEKLNNWRDYQEELKENKRQQIIGCIIMVACTLLVAFLFRP